MDLSDLHGRRRPPLKEVHGVVINFTGDLTGTLAYRTTFGHKKKPTTVDIKIDYECSLDSTSPFGTRMSLFTLTVHDTKGRLKERVKTTLTLKESGTEAVSSLADHH